MLKKFGLSEKDKFVCLIVRDATYLNTKFPYQDWSYWNFRDFDVDNFLLTAEELVKRGYFVFRMGKYVSKPIKSKNPKIIDYANSDLSSDFMDIYLAAKCTCFISAGSGFYGVPYVFRKPLVIIVAPLMGIITTSENILVLSKHYFSKIG